MKRNSLDFKLNYYYYKYKDIPLPNGDGFRKKFKAKHGNFPYLNELIVMIINYQVRKYGCQLDAGEKIVHMGKEKFNGKYKKGKETWYI